MAHNIPFLCHHVLCIVIKLRLRFLWNLRSLLLARSCFQFPSLAFFIPWFRSSTKVNTSFGRRRRKAKRRRRRNALGKEKEEEEEENREKGSQRKGGERTIPAFFRGWGSDFKIFQGKGSKEEIKSPKYANTICFPSYAQLWQGEVNFVVSGGGRPPPPLPPRPGMPPLCLPS